ncbi:Protein of unknown function (DUF421) [Promicromonospora umidemergens]|uniref:DUF421 domain-containing protein n=1 Tax=Promicromonospora umidemergens TaxID=629679 RepID=A0ABP8WYG8_9MICO|nr:YetF domain-containing protein [Promicromonospora umidemergens]MCP2285565.1 Protein of unknown function (DUF421) [Promicromonospora umidemergens]
MDAVLRAVAIYVVLLVIFRLTGKRSMAQVTTFDFIILLIVGEATQQALLGEDFSITQAALVIATLVLLERLFDYASWRLPRFKRVAEGLPVIVVENGRPLQEAMTKEQITTDDVLSAARASQGLERMDQIKWAVLEASGGISIVPKSST